MLLTFGVMALVRIKSTEGLTQYAPGEFGLVLGLDRAPEMKTARRKLAGRNQARDFSRAFSERWATEAPEAYQAAVLEALADRLLGHPPPARRPCSWTSPR